MEKAESLKIVTLGQGGVGKTSLITRFVSNKFRTKGKVTEYIGEVNKKIVINSQDIILNI